MKIFKKIIGTWHITKYDTKNLRKIRQSNIICQQEPLKYKQLIYANDKKSTPKLIIDIYGCYTLTIALHDNTIQYIYDQVNSNWQKIY